MGQAKQRAQEISRLKERNTAWRGLLSPDEQLILQVAERLDERLVRGRRFSEGCYHLAFFMTRYLADKGIAVTPIIGWVNDGTWKGMTSHAWIEFNQKKTDVSLGYTTHPEAQPIGALIVHDWILRQGVADYNYHQNDALAAQAGIEWMRTVPEWVEVLKFKQAQHATMIDIADAGSSAMDDYFASAPAGAQYRDLAYLVEKEK